MAMEGIHSAEFATVPNKRWVKYLFGVKTVLLAFFNYNYCLFYNAINFVVLLLWSRAKIFFVFNCLAECCFAIQL